MSMPQEGVRILEWTVWQVGGMSMVMLGSLGAEVDLTAAVQERYSGLPHLKRS